MSGASKDSVLAGDALLEAVKFLLVQWNWDKEELCAVSHIPISVINSWIKNNYISLEEPLSVDAQLVIQLIAIHKNLYQIFENRENQLKWLDTIHPEMGMSPKSKMVSSVDGLVYVRQYLDYQVSLGV